VIYFLKRSDGLVKIGCTGNYYQRYGHLKRDHGELELLGWIDGGMGTEKNLHIKFTSDRMEGEWFNHSDELKSYIETEASHEAPERPVKPEVKSLTLDDYFEEKIAEVQKTEREQIAALKEQAEKDRIQIIKLEAQLEMMEKLALKLQDHAIDAALKFVKEQRDHQIKLVS
jgi:hypothetical protein